MLYVIDLFEPLPAREAVQLVVTLGIARRAAALRHARAPRVIAMPERLANSLKEQRAGLGLTQAELAERVGVTRKTINTVENGVFTPSALLAIKLAEGAQRAG